MKRTLEDLDKHTPPDPTVVKLYDLMDSFKEWVRGGQSEEDIKVWDDVIMAKVRGHETKSEFLYDYHVRLTVSSNNPFYMGRGALWRDNPKSFWKYTDLLKTHLDRVSPYIHRDVERETLIY